MTLSFWTLFPLVLAYLDYVDVVVALLLSVACYMSAVIMMMASIERAWEKGVGFAFDGPEKLADEVERQFRKMTSRENSTEPQKRFDVTTYDARVISIRSSARFSFERGERWLYPHLGGYEVAYVVIYGSDEGEGILVNETELASFRKGDKDLKEIAAEITDALLRTTWIKIPARQWSIQDR